MGKKIKHAPVYFAIAQVRHNPVLRMGDYVTQIQESMRLAGYPDFKRTVVLAFNFVANAPGSATLPGDPQVPTPQQVERFTFANAECTRGFIVENNALSLQATEYDTFESFAGEFFKGLQIIHDTVKIAYVERVGTRYLDAVVPKEGESGLPKYLKREVLGLAQVLADDISVSRSISETHFQASAGRVLARAIIQSGPLGFPLDLQPMGVNVAPRFSAVRGVHAILDTDASYEGRHPFDMAWLRERLDGLHTNVRAAFDSSVTPHALHVWNREN